MQIYCYDGDLFTDFKEAIKGNGKLRALSVLFEVKKVYVSLSSFETADVQTEFKGFECVITVLKCTYILLIYFHNNKKKKQQICKYAYTALGHV